MAELNKYSMYNFMVQNQKIVKDKVDQMIDDVMDINDYNYISSYVNNNFGDVDGIKWFNYPEFGKKVYILKDDKKVEICMFKKNKRYYGKGWKKK